MDIIGKGKHTTVYLVKSIKYGSKFAAKVYQLNDLNKEKLRSLYNREISSLKILYHPNIVKIYDTIETNDKLIVIMEYCKNGSLREYFNNRTHFNTKEVSRFFDDIINSINHCHKNNITHGDIRPEKILLDEHDRIRLSGFANSCINESQNSITQPIFSHSGYSSPEVLQNAQSSPFKADMWSLGVLFYELITNKKPWYTSYDVERKKVINRLLRFPSYSNEVLNHIVIPLLNVVPECRPSIQELVNNKELKNLYLSRDSPLKPSITKKTIIKRFNRRKSDPKSLSVLDVPTFPSVLTKDYIYDECDRTLLIKKKKSIIY